MTDETARRWMNAYRNDGERLLQNNLGATSVYLLTAPSVPESARAEALERAESGEKLTVKATEEIVARHKAELAAMEERAVHLHVELQPERGGAASREPVRHFVAVAIPGAKPERRQTVSSGR